MKSFKLFEARIWREAEVCLPYRTWRIVQAIADGNQVWADVGIGPYNHDSTYQRRKSGQEAEVCLPYLT